LQLSDAARRKIAAQQTVIVSDRRSREPNDLDQAKPDRQLPIAICFFKDLAHFGAAPL
jgi:hypothetical protein